MSKYFVTCARGIESVTAKELEKIGAKSIEEVPGGLYFEGDQDTLYLAHLWLRTANRILLPLREFPCRSPEELYENLLKFKWETFFQKDYTFSVDCRISGKRVEGVNHSHYAKLKAKDAIVDRLREKLGDRPNVDKDNPDLSFDLYLKDGKATLSLDATGRSLHERGYRSEGAQAPLKESLAAALLILSGFQPEMPVIDAFCGSGTLLAEAALIASNFAPGLLREKFLFQNWPDYHHPRWEKHVEEAKAKTISLHSTRFFGFDKDPAALRQTNESFKALGLFHTLKLDRKSFSDFSVPEEIKTHGLFIINPPYGERLEQVETLSELYKSIGDTMKKNLKGWKAGVFTGNLELGKKIGLRATRRIPLFNGPIDSRLFTFDLY